MQQVKEAVVWKFGMLTQSEDIVYINIAWI